MRSFERKPIYIFTIFLKRKNLLKYEQNDTVLDLSKAVDWEREQLISSLIINLPFC